MPNRLEKRSPASHPPFVPSIILKLSNSKFPIAKAFSDADTLFHTHPRAPLFHNLRHHTRSDRPSPRPPRAPAPRGPRAPPRHTVAGPGALIAPIARDAGLRFAGREGGKTVGSGVVTAIEA